MADYRVAIATAFDIVFNAREAGLAAAVEYLVNDNEGNTIVGPTNSGVAEIGTTGVYKVADVMAPGTVGDFTVIWSKDGSFDPNTNAVDYLVTYDPGAVIPDIPPLTPISGDGQLSEGPCQAWSSEARLMECCGLDSMADLSGPLVAASQMLYALSNKLYPGTCERRVRPCGTPCGGPWQNWDGWGWLPMNRPGASGTADLGVYGSWSYYAGSRYNRGCGCTPLSRVPLTGSVREILEVTIDGQLVDPSTYRLDERRWLTRVPDPSDPDVQLVWPSCQDLSLPETDDGTFSILYRYGNDPPVIGQYAAEELACAVYATCQGGGSVESDCDLPAGVTKIERRGITIDLDAFRAWGWAEAAGWSTGLPSVDMFLNTYAPQGIQRRTRVWSPDSRRFPRPQPGVST
jgi:hypothetical protein